MVIFRHFQAILGPFWAFLVQFGSFSAFEMCEISDPAQFANFRGFRTFWALDPSPLKGYPRDPPLGGPHFRARPTDTTNRCDLEISPKDFLEVARSSTRPTDTTNRCDLEISPKDFFRGKKVDHAHVRLVVYRHRVPPQWRDLLRDKVAILKFCVSNLPTASLAFHLQA